MAARPFQCPPEFVAADPAPPPELCGAALGGGNTELWLIRAPAAFRPESLQGCSVPLEGCGWLHPPGDTDGDGRPYRLRGGPDFTGGGGPLLLVPQKPGGALSCAPPLRGCITITESCGEPPPEEGTRKRKKRKKKRKEQPPDEGGGSPEPPQTLGDPEGPEPPRRKKKKRHKNGEDAADPIPPQ